MRFRPGKEKVRLLEEINGCDMKLLPDKEGVMMAAAYKDRFYEKLGQLNESSGLSILFNFRQTSLDLYKFYKEVTVRGGYHQVTKENEWDEVASSIHPKGISTLLPDQLQKIYANLLFPFEQIYHYRTSIKDYPRVDSTSGQRSIKDTSVKDEDIEIKLEAPLRPRSAYQIFLTKECERLKRIHGENLESINTCDVAIEAWRELSMEMRKPYIEESGKEKERLKRRTKTYHEEKQIPALKPQEKPSHGENLEKMAVSCTKMMWPISDSDYHVTVELAPENINVPNESDIELALKLMKNKRVNDMAFQTNLEEFWSR